MRRAGGLSIHRTALLLVEEPEFNLPAVCAMIGPLFQSGSGLQHEISWFSHSPAVRPPETAYFYARW